MTQGDVLVVGDKVDHLTQRNQLDAFSGAGADVAARTATGFGRGASQGRELDAIGSLGFL
ncbi:hypothetical protein D3C81_2302410 [compost metagenome]